MNSLRIRFGRGEQVKFISHLDLMKTFERAIRRSGLPIAYSQGFNPHPHMVFGLPLSVGVTSEAEYADFDTAVEVAPEEFVERLNRELPEGLKLIKACTRNSSGNIMASISGALYEITLVLDEDITDGEFSGKIANFLGRETIMVKKEGKKGIKDIDIRPMIRKLESERLSVLPAGYETFKAAYRISALLDAGSVSNIKPELVAGAFTELEGLRTGAVRIHRKELYVGKPDNLTDPMSDI